MKTCCKCGGPIRTPLLGDEEERCVHCADYDEHDPDFEGVPSASRVIDGRLVTVYLRAPKAGEIGLWVDEDADENIALDAVHDDWRGSGQFGWLAGHDYQEFDDYDGTRTVTIVVEEPPSDDCRKRPCATCRRVEAWMGWLESNAAHLSLDDLEDRQALADMLALAVREVPS